jgi:hypothetical protein
MATEADRPTSADEVAVHLACELEARGAEYAIGGAIALGFSAEPRGTVDVDLTLFMPQERSSEAIRLLQQIGCEVVAARALTALRENGFCRTTFRSLRVDVFVQTIPFYEEVKARRRRVRLLNQEVMVLDGESLAVFKLMFFRAKDLVDVRSILELQGASFDRQWVRQRLVEIVGLQDPRIARWDELCDEMKA